MSTFLSSTPKHDMGVVAKTRRGLQVAQLLTGSWRSSPTTLSALELAELADLLLRTGAGGLAWCSLRDADRREIPAAESFQAAYRHQSLQAALHQRSLKRIISLMRQSGIEPLLFKGWSIARRYPEPGMRPYVDLDLGVLPADASRAHAALSSLESQGCSVDLHIGFDKFFAVRTEEIFDRSHLVSLDDIEVRVLCSEDELRLLCIHLLRHGAASPLWLCDLAVFMEAMPRDFDWDRCLSGSRREADWIACAIGLASQLLSVDVSGTPVARRAENLPSWLVPSVLATWGTPLESRSMVAGFLRHPIAGSTGLLEELSRHWPNPIEATVSLRCSFNSLPRLPFQLAHVVSRAGALLPQLFRQRGAVVPGRG